MTDSHPPPTYSQEDPTTLAAAALHNGSGLHHGPQLLVLPTVDAIGFQCGYLGAEGERAAIEGEVQIKDIDRNRWSRLAVSLRTYEAAYQQEIELNFQEINLHSQETGLPFPSSFPFSIPLPPDTPQSLQTPQSSLAHNLTASLYPVDAQLPPLSRSITVHTRRYTVHTHTLPISPEVHVLSEPTPAEIQVPRTSFKVGEHIPVYITVSPPLKEIVVDRGLRLRNARVELVRVIKVKREVMDGMDSDSDSEASPSAIVASQTGVSSDMGGMGDLNLSIQSSSAKAPLSPLFFGSSYKTVIARSGASCRFHSTRPIQLRFILHPPSISRSPSTTQNTLPGNEYSEANVGIDAASITQATLLHTVTFYLHIQIAFLDTKQQLECTSTMKIPIKILPPPARLPEISQTFDEAYSKKHDRPPIKTNRYDDSERAVPHYSAGEAGPSMLHGGAPPPFEEPDAPPPFFSSAAEASTSTRLPTFLESEREILIPDSSFTSLNPAPLSPVIEGEGSRFGFHAVDQFDGHAEEIQRPLTPPPPMEMAVSDRNLTALTEMRGSSEAIEVLAHVLEQHEENMIPGEQLPPPPPAMDDPSDPPPSIDDSVFRRPDGLERTSHSPPIPVYHEGSAVLPPQPGDPPTIAIQTVHGHAPPPYPVPDVHHDQENTVRPPPYSMG